MGAIVAGGLTGLLNQSSAQVIDGSLKFGLESSSRMTRTMSAGDQTKFTMSCWVKRTLQYDYTYFIGTSSEFSVYFTNTGKLHAEMYSPDGSTWAVISDTQAVFRDTSAFYHVVATLDSSAGTTNADRFKFYVNGVQQIIDFTVYWGGLITGNVKHVNESGQTFQINSRPGQSYYNSFYLSQYNYIDGQALDPSYFGFTDGLTNTWRPKKFSGNYTQTSFNNGTTWSSSLTSNGTLQNAGNAFDGDLSSRAQTQSPAADKTLTFSPPAINFTQKLEVYCDQGSAVPTATWNGNTVNPGGGAWVTVYTGSGTLSSTYPLVIDTETASQYATLKGVRIDGEVLIDGLNGGGVNSFYLPLDGNSPIGEDKSGNGNDFTPVNFSGSVALDNPQVSGARPILNTGGGGNVARVGVFGSEVGFRDTVSGSSGGGNPYIFNTRGTQPTFNFIRGATYVFDYSGATSHPLRFATAADAAGSTEYTDGTSVSGNVISFTVPHNAPNTLHYYCTNHSGMGNSISVTTDETKADPYAWKNVLALPLVGSKDDVSNYVYSGSTTKVITATNSVASSAASNFYGGSWYFDGSGDTLTVPNNTDFNFGSGDSTIEMWIYPTRISGTQENIMTRGTSDGYTGFIMSVKNFLDTVNGSSWGVNITYDNPLIANAWQHIAVCRSGNTWTVYINGIANGSATVSGTVTSAAETLTIGQRSGQTDFQGYMSDIHIYKGAAKYTSDFVVPATSPDILPDTPSGVSGGSKLAKVTDGAVSFDGTNDYLEVADSADFTFGSDDWTMECFVYPRTPGSNSYQSLIHKYDGSSASGSSWFWSLYSYTDGSSSMNFYFYSGSSQYAYTAASKVVRHNTWNHIVATKDGNTVRLYVNGVQDGTIDVTGYTMNDSSTSVRFGTDGAGAYDMSGFISNARIIKGTCLYTNGTAFTPPTRELTNVTNTKLLCCQSNTSATEGAVKPGSITANGDAAATNFNPFNTDINTVRGQETGYATLNPLKVNSSSSIVLSDGNLRVDITGNYYNAVSTLGMSSGKFYCEISPLRGYSYFGIATGDVVNNTWGGDQTNNTAWVLHTNGSIYHNNATTNGTGFPTPGTSGGYVLGLLFDADNKTMRYVDNGMISNIYNMANTVDGDLFYFFVGGDAGSYEIDVNFGQKPFKFPPPDGFQPLNAANVKPVKVIARPDQFVGATLYTGNGGTQSIDVGLKPDFVWVKARDGSARSHFLYDSVRGVELFLQTDGTAAESALQTNTLSSFNYDGFTTGSRTGMNDDGVGYVTWTWKAGGNKNTFNVDDVGYASAAAAGLDGGSLNPTGASVNTKSKFGIYTWNGHGSSNETLAHGLGAEPDFMICKKKSASGNNWVIWHKSIGTTKYLMFTTNAVGTDATLFNSHTNDSNNLWSLGTNGTFSDTGQSAVAYLWCDVPGLQKFGQYTGNNDDDGPFVELGFRPSIILIFNLAGGNWYLYDHVRPGYNVTPNRLYPNLSNAEDTGDTANTLDILSNGFKIRQDHAGINADGGTFIYMTWAEAPTFNLFGGQSNAR